jgi:predicted solute-binding protein
MGYPTEQWEQHISRTCQIRTNFAEDLGVNIDANKPIRVAIAAPFTALSQLYSGEIPSGPVGCDEYTENPAGLELARQVYSHLFGPITLESMRRIIRHGT